MSERSTEHTEVIQEESRNFSIARKGEGTYPRQDVFAPSRGISPAPGLQAAPPHTAFPIQGKHQQSLHLFLSSPWPGRNLIKSVKHTSPKWTVSRRWECVCVWGGGTEKEEGVVSAGVPCAFSALLRRVGRRQEKPAFSIVRELWERPLNGLSQSSKWPQGGRMDQQPFLGTQKSKYIYIFGHKFRSLRIMKRTMVFVVPLLGDTSIPPPIWFPAPLLGDKRDFNQPLHLQGLIQPRAVRTKAEVTTPQRGFTTAHLKVRNPDHRVFNK